MKIGIATFSWSNNYGAVIQAYALQTYLLELGHQVQIINYNPFTQPTGIKQYLAKTPKAITLKCENAYKRKLFQGFRDKYLNLTTSIYKTTEDLNKIIDEFDILISGSDQVWNPKWLDQQNGLWELCFLKFAGKNTRVISYAASFGHAEITTMKPEWQEAISYNLQKFDAISVREKSGIEIITKLTNKNNAFHVVDPTLLIEKTYYDRLIGKVKKKKPYLFSYMLHGLDNESISLEKKIADAFELYLIKCNANKSSFHKGYQLPSPAEWLGLIKGADIVITNSFHGVVFCLIFHTPFIALLIEGEIGSMNTRIIDLLNEVGLASQIVSKSTAKVNKLSIENINWKFVDQEIKRMREQSVNFLLSNVKL
jgi:polysaccharide pyruvyl transferase WcaK-like protein